MSNRRLSTFSRDQDRRMWFWLISRPEVATPPALDALPGAYRILAFRKASTASSVDGMFAPSATQMTPLASRVAASLPSSSFWVAQGRAMSHFTPHGFWFSKYCKPCSLAYTETRSRRTSFSSIKAASCASVMPLSGNSAKPLESDTVSTFAPSWMAFSQAYCATFPLPEITTRLPSSLSPLVCSMDCAK